MFHPHLIDVKNSLKMTYERSKYVAVLLIECENIYMYIITTYNAFVGVT